MTIFTQDVVRSHTITINIVAVPEQCVFKIDRFVGNASQVKFDTSSMYRTNSLSIFLNGILLERGADYNEDTNRQYAVLSVAPGILDKVEMRYVKDFTSIFARFMIESFVGDSTTLQFNTSYPFRLNSLAVFLNGVLQGRGVDYVEDGDRKYFALKTQPLLGDKIEVRYVNEFVREVFRIDMFNGNLQQRFNTTSAYRSNSLFVFLNGVLQERGVDYTEDIARKYFAFFIPVQTSDKLEARYVED